MLKSLVTWKINSDKKTFLFNSHQEKSTEMNCLAAFFRSLNSAAQSNFKEVGNLLHDTWIYFTVEISFLRFFYLL